MNDHEKSSNVVWHNATVTRERREEQNGHRGGLFWFTGLSGAGKSTLAHSVEEMLHLKGYRTFVLDGDNVRHGLCADLSFSDEDRKENIRRIGHMVMLYVEAGIIVLTAFISPFRADRDNVRKIVGSDFHEITASAASRPAKIATSRVCTSAPARARSLTSPASVLLTKNPSSPI